MTDSVPPPLPTEKRCCGSSMLPFLAGLLIGGGVVAAGGYVYLRQEEAKAERAIAEAAMNQAGQALNNMVGGALNLPPNPFGGSAPANAPAVSDPDKLKKLGDDIVDDLRQGRALLVYRHTTPEYRKKITLEEFEKTNVDTVNVRNIYHLPQLRVSKVLKATEGNGYEYYCTASILTNQGVVNFAFTFVPVDNDWQISDMQIKFTPQ